VYLSEPMDVTSYTAGEGSVSMVLSPVSDKVRDELCFVLKRCGIRVIAERPSSHRQMSSFRQREGACLLKTPDLVLQDFHAPRSFTIIDIKIVDPSAASYVQATAKSALHRHRALEAAGPRDYFGPSRRPPPGSWCSHEGCHLCSLYFWFPWCSSSNPHQGHRQTHQPLRAFLTCSRDIVGYLVHHHISSISSHLPSP